MQTVMVWGGGICTSGIILFGFVDQMVKITQDIYRHDLFEAMVVPWAHEHFGGREWPF